MYEECAEAVPELSYTSPPEIYIVETNRGALYLVDLLNPDVAPTLTPYSAGRELLFDEQPLPGLSEFRFDVAAGEGVLVWAKPAPTRLWAAPGYSYAGTVRRTSAPVWIGRIRSSALASGPPPGSGTRTATSPQSYPIAVLTRAWH